MFRSEELALAQHVARLAIWEWEPKTDVLKWQPGASDLFGRPVEELTTGNKFFECVHPDDRDRVRELLRNVDNETAYHIQFRVQWRSGDVRWIAADGHVTRASDGRKILIGVDRDITDEKAREEKLRAQARLLELANEPILVRDAHDRITYWNSGAQLLYGYTREEASGRVSHVLLRTRFPEPLEEIDRILHQTGFWRGELIHRKKDGNYIHVETRWQRFPADGSFSTLETNFDLSHQKALQVAKVWEEKAKLIGELAHGINNPLDAASGATHMLKGQCGETVPASQYVQILEASIERIAEFIKKSNELHQLARREEVEITQPGPKPLQ